MVPSSCVNVYIIIHVHNWEIKDSNYEVNMSHHLHSWLITGFVTRLTRRVPLVEQELLTLPEHLSSLPVFSGVHVTRYLVLYVCFVDRCLSFCTFSFDHCVVCSSLIYGFWLPLWYLQTLLGYLVINSYKTAIVRVLFLRYGWINLLILFMFWLAYKNNMKCLPNFACS